MAKQQDLRARVFISCGQSKHTDEASIARDIDQGLQELGFEPYVAIQEQSLRGLKENLFGQLSRSEYFIFVDFKREQLIENPPVHRGSLFSHQELALASYLDMTMLAFQESGVKQDDGILQFLQANATPFTDRHSLPGVIADEVRRRKWDPHWRNELVLERDPAQRGDSIDSAGRPRGFFHISVCNRHCHNTATNCCVYLERAARLNPWAEIALNAAELKWSGYVLPSVHIPPRTVRKFDAFFIHHDLPGLLGFATFSDSEEFIPHIEGTGLYELRYVVISDNFAPAHGSFILNLEHNLSSTTLIDRGDVAATRP